MIPHDNVEARPRSTVEILDDGCRICFADPLLLLSLTFLFYLPAATSLVVLVAQPDLEASPWRVWLPALTALLVPLTGLSAGACQEAFHSWTEGYDASFGECLKAALQRGLYHIASQALSLLGPVAILALVVSPRVSSVGRFFGIVAFVLCTVATSLFSLSQQPSFAAGRPRFWRAVRYGMRVSADGFDRAILLVVLRGLLLVFAVLNLHLFSRFALAIAENLGGFDIAFLTVLCSLGNGAYALALILLAWCLLRPFVEATDYLFFVDARTRFEGLDLWNRVQDLFPIKQRSQAGMILLALGVGMFWATPSLASDQLPAIRVARQEVQTIRAEVKDANPFPGSQRWQDRLEKTGAQLEKNSGTKDGFRWFQLSVKDFAKCDQVQGVNLLDDLDARLALVEDSLSRPRKTAQSDALSRDEIKNLIPPEKRPGEKKKSQKLDDVKDKDDKPPVQDDKPGGEAFGKPAGPGMVGPTGIAGAANVLLIMLVGIGTAVLLATIAYVVYTFLRDRPKAAPRQTGNLPARVDDYLEDPDKQDPSQLWRQADERARSGDYLGAVRTLYLAVLALLHQGGFIRYERTRTNGEYVDQLRPRALLQRPFLGLTGLFEVKWYGERACAPNDYDRCRELAEELRVAGQTD